MDLLSIFKRAVAAPHAGAAAEPVDAVQRARIVARRRLIGAAVLLVIGVIGFPLVFETQPRPIPVDIPIEVPRKDGATPLVMPPARTPATSPAPAAEVPAAKGEVITESRGDAGRELPPPVATAKQPATKPETKPEPKPVAKPAAAVPSTDAARARALLEDKPAAAAESAGRFIVQVGAFADASAAREARAKVEKLGLKTYTQVANTPAGNRIRVRVGPFTSRADADKALAKARSAGLAAAVLTL